MLINFRDFGGIASGSGHVRPGLLFRSGHLGELADADVASMLDHGFHTIADLRYAGERSADRSPWPVAYAGRVHAHDGERSRESPHLELLRANRLTPQSARAFYLDLYRALPFDPLYRGLFAQVVRRMATEGGKTLIHCSAGKDRTGILCALILDLLGVERSWIERDYLASRGAPGFAAIKAKVRARTLEKYGHAIPEDALYALLDVEPDYLAATFDEIERKCDSVRRYFSSEGISNDHLDLLRQRFTL